MTYSVREMHLTIQGEGANAGRVALFVRFSGCNLWSGREEDRARGAGACAAWCDTNFVGTDGVNGGRFETAADLVARMSALWPLRSAERRFCVLTGGEPALQLDEALCGALRSGGWRVAIETNGTHRIPGYLDWITVSPKAGTKIVQDHGNELKIVYPQEGIDPADFVAHDFVHFYISPKWSSDPAEWRKNTRAVIDYCIAHPQWRVSVQSHKFLEIP